MDPLAGDLRIAGARVAAEPQAHGRVRDLTPQVLNGETMAREGGLRHVRPLGYRHFGFAEQVIRAKSAGQQNGGGG
jgi:hypothetical protein